MTTLEDVKEMLEMIQEDQSCPKSLREKIDFMKKTIEGDQENQLKIDTLQNTLEEISNDVNIPSFVRTQVWSVSSALETVQ